MLPASGRYRRRVLAMLLTLLCLRHFFTLRRRSGFMEPSFFRNSFSTYFARIHASFSCLWGRMSRQGPSDIGPSHAPSAAFTVSWREAASSDHVPGRNSRRCG